MAQVWADRFEGERSKLGELQLDVVSRLANSLDVELVRAEALRSTRERPSNPDAVDLAMQAEVKESIRKCLTERRPLTKQRRCPSARSLVTRRTRAR